MSRVTVLPLLLLVIALPAIAGITGERPVSTPVYARVTDIRGAAIASNGDQYLAVWLDRIVFAREALYGRVERVFVAIPRAAQEKP